MVKVYAIDGITPVIDPSAYVHPSAVLIGDVIVGAGVYIGPCASVRGDFGRIVIHRGSNVQDGCIIHGFSEQDTVIEEDGHLGHGCIVHCATVRRNAMVGMNAVVNDCADIGESAIVAGNAFVRARMVVPPRMLVGGTPAKLMRELTAEELAWKIEATGYYQRLAVRSLATMTETTALTAVEPDRRRIDIGPTLPMGAIRKQGG